FVLDEDGRYVDVLADGKEENLLVQKSEIIGKTPYNFFDNELADKFTELLQKALDENNIQSMQYSLDLAENTKFFELRMQAYKTSADALHPQSKRQVVSIVRDMTSEHTSEQNAKLLESVFKEATEGVMVEDENRNAIYVNESMEKLLGMESAECIGKHSEFFSRMLSYQANESIRQGMIAKGHWHGEVELTRADNSTKFIWLSLDAVNDRQGIMNNIVIMATDISEIRRTRKQLEELATHDPLTGLPNRTLLFDRLEHTIAALHRTKQMGAVLFIDLDNFKYVNDEYGHALGDKVLSAVADCLRHGVRGSDTVARFGGDEFIVLVESVRQIDEVRAIVSKIEEKLSETFLDYGFSFTLSSSIGIALIPQDGSTAESLITAADRAMYSVKRNGKNGFDFYSPEHSKPLHDYFKNIQVLKNAFEEDAFDLVYQPRISLGDGSINGVEALLRTEYSPLKDISISQIVSLAEESGNILEISKLVLSRVCRQMQEWKSLSVKPLKVSVNLSTKEMENRVLPDIISSSMEEGCIDNDEIEFEITEETLRSDNTQVVSNFEALKQRGISFVLDDYGVGYSSLKELKKYNLRTLKIDKMLIDDLENENDDRIIVKATISMAKQLGLTVVAEGVENEKQIEYLKAFECDEIQGFYYKAPMDSVQLTELLRAVNA
ncbi:MAG TPA: bifunctional diguanylate cyclase/phosphodiesterase, partial [Epsilonproteobacteria bacterium]|nr:bifunctional diguanylate cyclase/phosphodiesterase [Campylobacterota bacterium]